ncbi:MAG TPA: hypothetical protein VKK79_23400 [Candidatus Lokiarchaeia archaeon]|nr:hypothetical protein [Candidatus Lokiarchaeia archaeon]
MADELTPENEPTEVSSESKGQKGGKLASIAVSSKLKSNLSDLKKQLSDTRNVTWNELIEMLLNFYQKKARIESELDQLQKAVTQIALNNAKFLGEHGGAGVSAPAYSSVPNFAQSLSSGSISSPPPPAPHLQGPPKGPSAAPERTDVQKEMVAELNSLFEGGGAKLQSVQDAIEEEFRQREEEIIQKTAEIITEELARDMPSARDLMQKLIAEQTDKDGTIFVIAKSVILELKKLLKSGSEDLATEADSLRLLAKQDSSVLQAELQSKRESPEFREALEKYREPLDKILNQVAKIREMVE